MATCVRMPGNFEAAIEVDFHHEISVLLQVHLVGAMQAAFPQELSVINTIHTQVAVILHNQPRLTVRRDQLFVRGEILTGNSLPERIELGGKGVGVGTCACALIGTNPICVSMVMARMAKIVR